MCPQQGGVNYYELNNKLVKSNKTANRFPSPTGVTYYELKTTIKHVLKSWKSFRPQQGLTITNPYLQNPDKH